MSKVRTRTSGINYPDISKADWDVLWQRNVRDKYKTISNEDIRADLKKTALPCAILMSQISGDFNFGCVIRTANNFNISKVFYYGNKRFDKRGAQGTYHYSDVVYLPTLEDIVALKRDYMFVGLENNVPNTKQIKDFVWPKYPLLIMGEEGNGISPEVSELLDYTIEIPSLGSTRSINVACAAAIALYDYQMKFEV